MPAFVVTLSMLPPSANHIWTRGRRGMYRSQRYLNWLHCGQVEASVAKKRQGKIKGPYALSILAVRPDKRKRDLDNLIKPIGDLLCLAGIVQDDSYCERVTARWVTTGGPLQVIVTPAGIE